MQKSTVPAPADEVAAYVGIDWAEQKHDVILRTAAEPDKVEHLLIAHEPNALMDWVSALQGRFAPKGKILVALEQSRGALIYHLMGYDFLELYPINPAQLSNFRSTFTPSGAKNDRSDAELICELLYCHRDRLKAWKADDELTRKLTFLNEGRRKLVDRRTELANEIKSQLKVYFPLALEVLDNNCTTALAAELLLAWPTLESLQKQTGHKLRQFFYAHHFRGEQKLLERLKRIKDAKPLTRDRAIIESSAMLVRALAQQLKALLPHLAGYEKQIAELFDSHPDSFLFRDLPGAGSALAPRLLTAFGTDRDRFAHASDLSSLSGVAPVRRASGKKNDEKAPVYFRHACPKFLRQSFHEFALCSIRYCPWAQACYQSQRQAGKGHHAAVRFVAFKWIRVLFACWKARLPYDPQRYLQSLQERGSAHAAKVLLTPLKE
jgi:transposase